MSSTTSSLTSPREVQYLDTIDAYDQWAKVYDTDGNFLQCLDTLQLETLLPEFLSHVRQSNPSPKIVDLGCGTGRNTLALVRNVASAGSTVIGLEPSKKMLEVAQDKMAEYFAKSGGVEKREVSFQAYNLLEDPSPPVPAIGADGVVSTLVLEHVPIPAFFRTTAAILKPGAILLLTNMHSEMGGISQAGFVDPETGVKIRPTSYSHTVKDTLEEAKIAGFELVGELKEARVDEEMAEKLGPRAKKWIGVQVWYGGCFRRK